MIIILYLSVALIAVAFLVLVIYLSKTLKSLQLTLKNVASTLEGLEGQMKGITTETAELLHKTNRLAEDIQEKSKKLNTVVHAVQGVGASVQQFNTSMKQAAGSVSASVRENQDKINQVVTWSQAAMEIWEKWKQKKKSAL
ncbi:DUF948 domain-containing protein [Bacillus subtilis]|uniref:General stress protein n=1 Tax=Bacillus subtilis TaxID=1423 RepID=A0A0D1JLJ7_BACIU|nr:DUF948 domain-containing protein [Bacillus subtilis]OTQ82160.1 hypothetical protein BG30_20980 [Bacillus subtilis subsp. subtilis]KIN54073.1 hypothetical protein B4146_3181 [Bacillus subtilis]KIU13399.1 hypothetical protein SC09_Contig17orf00644 [Bacillus subtilis]KZD93291.1 General stress protein [Bacillus subtilis]MDH3117765.1 DUF948 domain-containing protein [Bacillus subtilis]